MSDNYGKSCPRSLVSTIGSMMRAVLFTFCLIIPGGLSAIISGYYALLDYAKLQTDYAHFQHVAHSGAGLQAVFVAHAAQDIHRTNVFAEGVWALLGLVVFGVGLIGLCGTLRK